MKDKAYWKLFGWVNMGSQRKIVIKFLSERPITAEEVRRIINQKSVLKLSLREMSRHLTSFTEKGLTECLTPNSPYSRLYRLTKEGLKIRNEISK